MLNEHLIAKTRPLAHAENTVVCGNVRVSVLRDKLFRIEQSDGGFTDAATQCVWYRNFGKVDFTCMQTKDELRVHTAAVTLAVDLHNVKRSSVILNGKQVKIYNKGIFAGTGRTLDMNLMDTIYVTNKQGGREIAPIRDGRLLCGGVTSKQGVAYLDDGNSLVLGDDGMVAARNKQTDLYVFAFGHDYYGAVSALYDLTGKTPMLPKYVFGNWWSRFYGYTEEEYLALMDKFKRKRIPLSVATVDMDWHYTYPNEQFGLTKKGYTDAKYGSLGGWTGYTWNRELFPDYKRFLRALKERGLHVTLNLHPADGVRWFEECYARMAARLGKDARTKEVVSFDFTDPDYINAYFDEIHHPYENDGVDFWWIDWQQGTQSKIEGYDPLWGLNHFHYLDLARKKSARPLILSRYAGIGSHRYPLGFSGDSLVTWHVLRYIPYYTATSSNVGYSFWSHDIGGHFGGIKDNELYLRWLQIGLFLPILRLHSSNMPISGKEPWMFDSATESLASEILRERARLMPYIYSLACDNNFYNRPMIVPLYYKYPEQKESYQHPNEYFFGDLLVAPITERSDASQLACAQVWLPDGEWYDVYSDRNYSGGKVITVARDSGKIPVFVPAGGFVITDPSGECDVPKAYNVLTSIGNGSFELYEDDGNSNDYLVGKCVRTVFTSAATNDSMEINISPKGDTTILPQTREYNFTLRGTVRAIVTCNGESVETEKQDGNLCFTVTLPCNTMHTIVVTNAVQDDFAAYCKRNLTAVLSAYNCDNTFTIEHLFNAVIKANKSDLKATLAQWSIPANLSHAIEELFA